MTPNEMSDICFETNFFEHRIKMDFYGELATLLGRQYQTENDIMLIATNDQQRKQQGTRTKEIIDSNVPFTP